MPVMLSIYKGQKIGKNKVDDLHLEFTREFPIVDKIKHSDSIFDAQAEVLEKQLFRTLPGGTYDRLVGMMLKRKASHFIVTHDQKDKKNEV